MKRVRCWSPALRPLPSIPMDQRLPTRWDWVREAAEKDCMTPSPAPYRGHVFQGDVKGQVKLDGF